MVWQVIEIQSDGYYLCKHRGFLLVKEKDNEHARVPLDDVSIVMVSSHNATLSKSLITTLSDYNIPIVFCGPTYLPTSITLPYGANYRFKAVVEAQRNASKALNKNIWKTLVQQKIANQAQVLESLCAVESNDNRLRVLVKKVKSGDKDNIEAQAAKYYWKRLFDKPFKRNKNGADSFNVMLNYGYTVLRSACARAVVSSGLLPLFGVSHSNMYNPFCLVDDLIEPFRAFVDLTVVELVNNKQIDELTPDIKKALSKILIQNVLYNGEKTILGNAIQFMAQDIVKSFTTKSMSINVCEMCYE